MKRITLLLLILVLGISNIYSQSGICEESDPFCTSSVYTFPAGVNTGSAQSGPDYGCLNLTPNPAWYHMKIAVAGDINIFMSTSPLKDIDFICWGPFIDPYDPCASGLTSNMEVDCSYSGNPTENCYIPDGQVGEYYILLITNYDNDPCEITFQKTSGTGETDCTIVPPPVSNNSPLCTHDNLELYADNVNNAAYSWIGPSGFTSSEQNPVINDVDIEDAGTYSLVITVNGSPSSPIETLVIVNPLPIPDFEFNNACFGDATFFVDQSTVDPATSVITEWNWEFGDGQESVGQNQEYIYGNVGVFDVTLTTYTAEWQCERSITKPVSVMSAANVDAGSDITIPNGWPTGIDAEVDGGSGDYDLLWQPSNLLEDATVVDPTTISLGATTVFKLNVTDANSGCMSADSMTVIVTGGVLQVNALASPMTICKNEIVHLNALPSGGSGDNYYTWTSNPAGFTASIKEPSDYPQVTTTYTVSVFDGQNMVESSVTVIVKPIPVSSAGDDMTITVGTSTVISGSSINGGSGEYSYLWTPVNSLINPGLLHPETIVLDESLEFSLLVNDANGCSSIADNMYVFVGGNVLTAFPSSSATDNTICQGESVELYPNALGGGGSYTYLWSDEDGVFFTEETPVVYPLETTTYIVEVNDSFKIVSKEITIVVNHTPVINLAPDGTILHGDTISVCVRDSVILDASDPLNPPVMNYLWSTAAASQSILASTNGSWLAHETYWVSVLNPVTQCSSRDTLVVFFNFDDCNIGIDEENNLSSFISIYPNPTSDNTQVIIDGLSGTVSIYVLNTQGLMIWKREDLTNSEKYLIETIPFENNARGVYLVRVINEQGVFHTKLVKQ